MTFDEQAVLARFHRALVRELQAKDPEHIEGPFTVAEIYQNLIPYRTHRDEIGVEMSADYEHALLRLLAGEGDFLTIESRTARQEIREELDSPNPNTGLYRDFAAADVRLNPSKLAAVLLDEISQGVADSDLGVEETLGAEDLETEAGVEDLGEKEPSESEDEELWLEPVGANLGSVDEEGIDAEPAPDDLAAEVSDEAGGSEPESDAAAVGEGEEEDLPPFENCPWCREKLPQQARVRFCPFCGSSVYLIPCQACGEELKLNWRFCIACGTEVTS
jgi:hypothetical protein